MWGLGFGLRVREFRVGDFWVWDGLGSKVLGLGLRLFRVFRV